MTPAAPAPRARPARRPGGNPADPWPPAKRWLLRLAGGAAVALASEVSVAAGVPSWTSPYAFATVLLRLSGEGWLVPIDAGPLRRVLETLPLGAAFVLWTFFVVRDRQRIPWLSLALALSTVSLSALMILVNWSTALHQWGSAFTLTATAGNLAAVAALTVLAVRNRRTPSHGRTYAFHLVLFLWIAWCAVPWFAEGL